jgi:hypothetical protein
VTEGGVVNFLAGGLMLQTLYWQLACQNDWAVWHRVQGEVMAKLSMS